MADQDPTRRTDPSDPDGKDPSPRALGAPPSVPDIADPAERKRQSAQAKAQQQQRADEAQRTQDQLDAAAREQAEADQAELDSQQVAERPTKVGSGGVKVRYLGTSDEFILGQDEDGNDVVARAGIDVVDIPDELYETVASFPHDTFEKVSDEDESE